MALLGGGSPFGLGGYGDNFRQTEEPYSGPSITNGMSVGLLPSGYSYLYGGGTDPFEGTAAGLYAGGGPARPSTSTTGGTPGGGGTPQLVSKPNLAPTAAQVAANPGAYAGTSFDPTRPALSGSNVPYDPNWEPLLTPWNTTNPSQASDPLAWVRNLDQATYYKYILPYQQNGGDITNINAMTRAIQDGMARDGGGQWANGSTVNTVTRPQPQTPAPTLATPQTIQNPTSQPQSTNSPLNMNTEQAHQYFLRSNAPRAMFLNLFKTFGNEQERNAATTWLHQNITPQGTANQLDDIGAWLNRFQTHFNLGPQQQPTQNSGQGNNPYFSNQNPAYMFVDPATGFALGGGDPGPSYQDATRGRTFHIPPQSISGWQNQSDPFAMQRAMFGFTAPSGNDPFSQQLSYGWNAPGGSLSMPSEPWYGSFNPPSNFQMPTQPQQPPPPQNTPFTFPSNNTTQSTTTPTLGNTNTLNPYGNMTNRSRQWGTSLNLYGGNNNSMINRARYGRPASMSNPTPFSRMF